MIAGADEVVEIVASFGLSVYLVHWVLRRDEERLPPERFARTWPPSTRLAALVALGPLSLPIHFVRTRRSLAGLLLGVAWGAAVLAIDELVIDGLDAVVERRSDLGGDER